MSVFSLEAALIAVGPSYFQQSPVDARAALFMVKNTSEVLSKLLDGGHSSIAGRLAGAFRNIGRERVADEIVASMEAAGYMICETDLFERASPFVFDKRETSPYVNRIRLLWQAMRESAIEYFPEAPGLPKSAKSYLQHVDDVYSTDAYNSLSIEGYQVTTQLIERVCTGCWNPDENEADRIHPYMDGNGRIGRSLMNVMLASGGYPWTVIPVSKRQEYMNALEAASVNADIVPLTRFIGKSVSTKD